MRGQIASAKNIYETASCCSNNTGNYISVVQIEIKPLHQQGATLALALTSLQKKQQQEIEAKTDILPHQLIDR